MIQEKLYDYFTTGYGLLRSKNCSRALLKFPHDRGRRISEELLYPDLHVEWNTDGVNTLASPYSDHRELVLDILKFSMVLEAICQLLEEDDKPKRRIGF